MTGAMCRNAVEFVTRFIAALCFTKADFRGSYSWLRAWMSRATPVWTLQLILADTQEWGITKEIPSLRGLLPSEWVTFWV
jgi:hypothetical protein